MRAIKLRLKFHLISFLLQRLPSVHPECDEHRVESLPVRACRRCWAWYFDGQQNDPRAEHSSLRKRSSCYRRRESHGGNGSYDPLARNLAKGNPVLRRRAICYPMSDPTRKHIQVRVESHLNFFSVSSFPEVTSLKSCSNLHVNDPNYGFFVCCHCDAFFLFSSNASANCYGERSKVK